MGIAIKEAEYPEFGRCVRLQNHYIEALVTIDHGPRIASLHFLDGPNLLYLDAQDQHTCVNTELSEQYGAAGAAFHLYGGHRLSLAPQRSSLHFAPDNSPVVYGLLPGGVSFTPPRQKHSELQLSLDVMMGEDASDIMVVHKLRNCSRESRRLSLCACTAFAPGGVALIPQNCSQEESGLPNRSLSLWPGSSVRDPRLQLGDRYVLAKQSPWERELRLGINDVLGWGAYANLGYVVSKRFVYTGSAAYPDFGSSMELCLCDDYAELRSLSPLYTVEPGECLRFVENIALLRAKDLQGDESEAALDAYVRDCNL